MDKLMKTWRVVMIFGLAGLVGPIAWIAAWPPSGLAYLLPRFLWVFYTDLIELLWPASMMGLWVGVPANLTLFSILGVGVGRLARTRVRLWIGYAMVIFLVLLLALWQAGFSVTRVDVVAVAVAVLIYAIPFWVVMGVRGAGPAFRSL